jgi:uncharacterized membrane-anchored protein YitT (DUF2179 family)
MAHLGITKKKPLQMLLEYFGIALGSFLGALSIRMFLYPNQLIDGGIVGISLILGRLTNDSLISLYLILLNLPFVYLAYKFIRRTFVIQMLIAISIFAFFLSWLEFVPPFHGDPLEIIALGGAILGIGSGLIIRYGGCTDGSEILGIIANKRFGFTVGQVVLVFNFFVFTGYGLIFLDWHIAVKSLLTYIVAFKMIDLVIVGLDEIKSVTVISSKSDELSAAILEELGLGLTITNGRGGYTGEERNILNIIVERLDLADLKDLILKIDQQAFISISNIYEVVYSHKSQRKPFRTRRKPKAVV